MPEALDAITQSTADLKRLEGIIRRGIGIFYEVGDALIQIRDKKYYREILGFETFEEYCQKKWGMTKTHAYRLMDAKQVADNLSPMGDISGPEDAPPFPEIPERQLRPLTQLPAEEQAPAWELAVESAPEGKVTARHVENVVREIKEASAKTYRIRNTRTNEWWEGDAISCSAAVSASTWPVEDCEIKEKTLNGAGGWRKVKHKWPEPSVSTPKVDCQGCPDHRGMINKHHGVKVPGNYGKCIRPSGPCEKAMEGERSRKDTPGVNTDAMYFADLAIRTIGHIQDTDPGCKAALAKIALHVWNRQHKKEIV